MNRSILHCDMNNFYASVECMLDPSLRKYPVAVCGSVEERHGIVLAKNYAPNNSTAPPGFAAPYQSYEKSGIYCKSCEAMNPNGAAFFAKCGNKLG